jgi:hypothetical protein
MLYFSSAPVVPESIDPDQYKKLSSFRESCRARGLYESYVDLADFRSKLYRQLQLKVLRDTFFQVESSASEATSLGTLVNRPTLSREAAQLLKQCASEPTGTVLNIAYIGGHAVQVGEKNFVEEGSDRSRAVWTSAVHELETLGYLLPIDNKREIFRITKSGYEAADKTP